MSSQAPPGWESGTPGASARREAERRRANRERRVRERYPRIGGLILAFQGTPTHERNWHRGAEREARLAGLLRRRCGDSVSWLYDRRIPRSRANIDMLAFAPNGVWVVDAKSYKGKVGVAKPLFGKAKLVINGRDRSKLIDTLEWQVGLVQAAVGALDPTVPVHGALCFDERADGLPWFRAREFRGYPIGHPRGIAKRVRSRGTISAERMSRVRVRLAAEFPEA